MLSFKKLSPPEIELIYAFLLELDNAFARRVADGMIHCIIVDYKSDKKPSGHLKDEELDWQDTDIEKEKRITLSKAEFNALTGHKMYKEIKKGVISTTQAAVLGLTRTLQDPKYIESTISDPKKQLIGLSKEGRDLVKKNVEFAYGGKGLAS